MKVRRFAISYRDVEELLAERGIQVDCEAIRLCCRKFGQCWQPKNSFQAGAMTAPKRTVALARDGARAKRKCPPSREDPA